MAVFFSKNYGWHKPYSSIADWGDLIIENQSRGKFLSGNKNFEINSFVSENWKKGFLFSMTREEDKSFPDAKAQSLVRVIVRKN